MQLIQGSRKVKLSELDCGSLFYYDDSIALKSEYRSDEGICECFIVGSGEMFWGGTGDPNELMVYPVSIKNQSEIKVN